MSHHKWVSAGVLIILTGMPEYVSAQPDVSSANCEVPAGITNFDVSGSWQANLNCSGGENFTTTTFLELTSNPAEFSMTVRRAVGPNEGTLFLESSIRTLGADIQNPEVVEGDFVDGKFVTDAYEQYVEFSEPFETALGNCSGAKLARLRSFPLWRGCVVAETNGRPSRIEGSIASFGSDFWNHKDEVCLSFRVGTPVEACTMVLLRNAVTTANDQSIAPLDGAQVMLPGVTIEPGGLVARGVNPEVGNLGVTTLVAESIPKYTTLMKGEPQGFSVEFDVSLSPGLAPSGPMEVCLPYADDDQDGFSDDRAAISEADIRLFFRDGKDVLNVTTRVDTEANQVCTDSGLPGHYMIGRGSPAIPRALNRCRKAVRKGIFKALKVHAKATLPCRALQAVDGAVECPEPGEALDAALDPAKMLRRCDTLTPTEVPMLGACAGVTGYPELASCLRSEVLSISSQIGDDVLPGAGTQTADQSSCVDAIGKAARKYGPKYLREWQKCHGKSEIGKIGTCPGRRPGFRLEKARQRFQEAVVRSCTTTAVEMLNGTCPAATTVGELASCLADAVVVHTDGLRDMIPSEQ